MDWQPIDTAPKDANSVILWDGDEVVAGYYSFGRWYPDTERNESDFPVWIEPTHWMPLPDAPTT